MSPGFTVLNYVMNYVMNFPMSNWQSGDDSLVCFGSPFWNPALFVSVNGLESIQKEYLVKLIKIISLIWIII